MGFNCDVAHGLAVMSVDSCLVWCSDHECSGYKDGDDCTTCYQLGSVWCKCRKNVHCLVRFRQIILTAVNICFEGTVSTVKVELMQHGDLVGL